MATLTGLRLLHKNATLSAAIRLGTRARRIPKRIVYYSRFAAQLNFLRSSNNLSFKQIVNDDIERVGADFDELSLERPPPISVDCSPICSIQPQQQDNDNDKNELDQQSQNGLMKDLKTLFASQQEFNENHYIYRHIHKRLDRFADIGQMLDTLPIHSHVENLKQLLEQKTTTEAPDLHVSIDKTLSQIKGLIKYMNQQELAILLTAIKNNNETEYKTIKKMIDIELRWLLKKHVKTRLMDIDLWFYLADVFYECLMKSTFVHVLVNYMAKESEVTLSNRQFLHLLFLVILQRQPNEILSNYEERILQILNKASFEDIATVCMAYFKTKTPIKNKEILRKIIDQTTEYLPTIDPKQPGYCSIIKSIRYSRSPDCRENVLHLIMTLVGELDGRIILTSPYNAVHTIKLVESYRIYDPKLLDLVACNMFQNLDKFRIKDIQYALTTLSNSCYKDLHVDNALKKNFDRLCNQIVSETRPDADKQYYHLMPILRAFSMFGYYNNNLINYANQSLNDVHRFDEMKNVLEFIRSSLLVYVATRLEGDVEKLGEQGSLFHKLSASIERIGNMGSVRQDSSIKHLDFILRSTTTMNFFANSNLFRSLSKSLASAEELQDPAYKFNFQFTLPHQNYADLVISKNCREPGQFDAETLMPKRVPSGERHCLIYATRKEDYVDGHGRLSGYKRLVSRLLTKLGYIIIKVDLNEPNIDNAVRRIKTALDGGGGSSSSTINTI